MSKNITTIEKSAIEYLCGLIRELSNVSEGIDDINLKVYGTIPSETLGIYGSVSYPVAES